MLVISLSPISASQASIRHPLTAGPTLQVAGPVAAKARREGRSAYSRDPRVADIWLLRNACCMKWQGVLFAAAALVLILVAMFYSGMFMPGDPAE